MKYFDMARFGLFDAAGVADAGALGMFIFLEGFFTALFDVSRLRRSRRGPEMGDHRAGQLCRRRRQSPARNPHGSCETLRRHAIRGQGFDGPGVGF